MRGLTINFLVCIRQLYKFIKTIRFLGKALGPNQEGELLVKGPQVMKGYYKRPEETEKSFMDGWFKTGDIAYYNDDGFFFITERLKELIKVSSWKPVRISKRNNPQFIQKYFVSLLKSYTTKIYYNDLKSFKVFLLGNLLECNLCEVFRKMFLKG